MSLDKEEPDDDTCLSGLDDALESVQVRREVQRDPFQIISTELSL